MSYEAWGDGEDNEVPDWYYTQVTHTLHDDGWLDDKEAEALKQRAEAAEQRVAALEKDAEIGQLCKKGLHYSGEGSPTFDRAIAEIILNIDAALAQGEKG